MSSILSSKTLLLLFLSFLISTYSKLTVRTKTDNFSEKFDKVNGIDYVILNPQNKITFKRSFIGNAILASPETACESVQTIATLGDEAITNPVLVAVWGECHYAQKVRNAELAGAKMIILVLNNKMSLQSVRQISITTSIEVLAVPEEDGMKLVNYLRPKDNIVPAVEIIYSYNAEKQINYQSENKVTLDFWFVAADISKQAYEFLSVLQFILISFGDRVTFTPHYVLWRNEALAQSESDVKDYRCIAGGLYCDPEPETDYQIYGSKGVVEDLRQICFWKQEELGIWWNYINGFGSKCVDLERAKLDECRAEVYKEKSISNDIVQKVENCMRNSFEKFNGINLEDTTVQNKNDYLEEELKLKEETGVDHYPSLFVNKQRYTDSSRNLFVIRDFICSHFLHESMPKICFKNPILVDPPTTRDDFIVYGVLVVACILVMGCLLYCVRRAVKRQVMGRMNEEISHIVTQYKQFKDKSTAADDDL